MSEWWTYGLSDFLMFSPETYWRLVARYNAALWPAQLAGVAGAAALPALVRATGTQTRGAALLLLALAWAGVGWAFYWKRYAEIFLAAPQLALACGLQVLLLAAAALLPGRPATGAPRMARVAATGLAAAALLHPLLAPAQGRGWAEAEVFGFMPDPTALATLGTLLALPGVRPPLRAAMAVLPLLFLVLGAATRWSLA
jgi:hypothetical protein